MGVRQERRNAGRFYFLLMLQGQVLLQSHGARNRDKIGNLSEETT